MMAQLSTLKRPTIWPLLLLLLANGLILADPAPVMLRYAGSFIILGFLPGWIWLQLFLTRPLDITERLTLAIGLSLALTILTAMLAVYLPCPLTANQILVVSNVLLGAGLMAQWWQQSLHGDRAASPSPPLFLALILALLVSLAIALRLPRLGYAEFHEDEAEALMLGVRLFQGEDYALFLHRKGPAQMLLPVVFWLLTGHIDETLARLPFAVSSILSVATLFFLGRRWFNWSTGIVAGLLWAINGYAIGFARMAQYQALIFFLGPLAIYGLYLAWQYRQPRLQIPAAILLSTCLLAHFDALLLLPAGAYLIWLIVTNVKKTPERIVAMVALVLFLGLLASFYLPYLFDPEFEHTVAYLSGSRVKPGLLYNNLNLLQRLDKDYSSHFYMPLAGLGILCFAVWQSARFAERWRWAVGALGLFAASTLWLPEMWQIGSSSLAILPWLLLGLLWVWLAPNPETRVAWIMFGAAFIGYVFLVDDPRTHVYIMYPGVVLLAGAGWAAVYQGLNQWTTSNLKGKMPPALIRSVLLLLLVMGLLLAGAIVIYDITVFLRKESSLAQLRQKWDGSSWQLIYNDLPQERSYFGYPKREGWKAIGALQAQGKFSGDFRSINEDFIIPIWYNYGQARSCYNTPAQYFVRAPGDASPVTDEAYIETGQIEREGEIRLRIFSAEAEQPEAPSRYPLEAYEDIFDRWATPQHFTQQAEPAQRLEAQFGPAIRFLGYDLPIQAVAPGDTLYLNLYWQTLENPGANYRAFVHLTDGATLWAQQDDDPACRLPTSIWRVGQRGIGQFRLHLNPNTPPGRYPLVMGLYHAETLERLPITAGAGQPGDDFLWLGDIEITHQD
ncbi:MAG: glycosyltransferase family 39 protein [Anaerolineae bacterium]|nr:glycosyltransferase family 39 protein [Anaerolineae bacterium]